MQFDGRAFAQKILDRVQLQAEAWSAAHGGNKIRLHSIFPYEDDSSVMYTKLKQRDAEKNGMQYTTQALSLRDSADVWVRAVLAANAEAHIQGVLVQKPTSFQFQELTGGTQEQFDAWWSRVSQSIAPEKDVDCLGPDQLASLERLAEQTVSRVRPAQETLDDKILPATALAAVLILQEMAGSMQNLRSRRVAVIGRSQIVGRPAAAALNILGVEAELLSSQSNLREILPDFGAIISATGKPDLISADAVAQDVWLIDVGAPAPEFAEDCRAKAEWWTPVPGGVGPVTRACLLENAVRIAAA